jgi:3-oxoacyl-(acyl-carrier-protein) synthase III
MSRRPVVIASVAHALPDAVVSTEEVAARFIGPDGTPVMSASALRRLTGIEARRHAPPDTCSSDLAARAGELALDRADLEPYDVDVLIFASASHDVAEPATANRVQSLLGCTRARVFDLKNACNSFIDALDVASALIQREPALRLLIATGEVISPFIKWQATERSEVSSLVAGLTLGDAGAAAVITGETRTAVATLGPAAFKSAGKHWAASRIMAGGSMRGKDFDEAFFSSDSALLFALAAEHIPPVVKDVLARTGWQPGDVDLVVPHQASAAVTRQICEQTSIPFSRCMLTGSYLGNTAAASIPVALSLAWEARQLGPTSRVLAVGGAAGFSAAAVTLQGPDLPSPDRRTST